MFLRHTFHLFQVVLCLFFCIKWPSWLVEGYLDSMYLKVATFLAAYGGFVGSLIWYIKWTKKNK